MGEKKKTDEIEIDLRRLCAAIGKRIWAIVLAAVLCGSAALSYAAFLVQPTYEAKALMYINNRSLAEGNAHLSISPSELSAAQTLVNTYVVILKTRNTLEDVMHQAGVDYSYEAFSKMISAESVNGTEIFEIKVTSTDPREAERIANTITEVLPDKIAGVVEGSSVRVVDHAVVPVEKAAPSYVKYTVLGIALGLLLSCGAVVVLELRDDAIHDEDFLSQNYDIPLLAVIPDLSAAGESSHYYQSSHRPSDPQGQGRSDA